MLDLERLFDLLSDAGFDPEFMEDETELTIACPLCEDDRPRLYINTDSGAWLCFHCSEQGGLWALLKSVLNLDGDEAMEQMNRIRRDAEDSGRAWRQRREVGARPEAIIELPDYYRPIDARTPAPFLEYLQRRHIDLELARSREIGYAVRGEYAYRVILPVRTGGFLYSYVARTILPQCLLCRLAVEDCVCQPPTKKVLTAEGGAPRHTLYNYDAVVRGHLAWAVVVEGAFDALRFPDFGLALLGSAISPTQVALLAGLQHSGKQIVLMLDGDKTGRQATEKIAQTLVSAMVRPLIASLPDGEDPGAAPARAILNALDEAKEYVL